MLRNLCETHTNLSEAEIQKLESISANLDIMCDLVRADIFIDCKTRDANTAVVVAQGRPSLYPSLYDKSVVGELALRQNEPAVLRTLEIAMVSRELKAITQENKTVKQSVVPIKNDSNQVIAVLIMEKDVTENVKTNNQLKILEETTNQLTETILSFNKIEEKSDLTYKLLSDAVIIFDKDGYVVYSNPAAINLYEKLGYKDDILGMSFDNIALDGKRFAQAVSGQSFESSELAVGNLSVQIKYSITRNEDNIVSLVMLIKDVTEEKQKEKELILKSVAIREIHHRVKNNLQTIASLLRLQSRRIEDENSKKLFNESICRILSISVTHELLAQNGVDDIDLMKILTKIKETTLRCFIEPNKNIKVQIKGDSFEVDSDKATSIALIVNELIQNSLEHGFVGKNEGEIQIIVQKGIMYSKIYVIDDGIGFIIKNKKTGSLGLSIVEGIVKDKLNGNINIDSCKDGTKIVFDFRNK